MDKMKLQDVINENYKIVDQEKIVKLLK